MKKIVFLLFISLVIITVIPVYAYNSAIQPIYQPSLPPSMVVSVHDIGNVTKRGCTLGQVLAVNGSAIWACFTLAGVGEINTASNVGIGHGLFKQKTLYNLEFKNIFCAGSLLCSSNATDIKLTYTATGGGNMSRLGDGGDVTITNPNPLSILYYVGTQWINKIFSVNTLSSSNDVFITGINNQTGVVTTNQFSVNTLSSSNDVFITGINNVTGEITRNTFSINQKTCSGTDKINSIDNATGYVICTIDQTGSITTRESNVANWETDKTWANIGVSFVNVFLTGTGDPFRIDTNGKTTVTLMIDWTKVGAGTQKCKIAQVGAENTILIMATNLVSGINTNATVSIPAAQQNTIANYKPMCLSSTNTDDPVWLSGQVLLR